MRISMLSSRILRYYYAHVLHCFSRAHPAMSVQVTASIQTVTAFIADLYIALALSVILWGKKTGFTKYVLEH